MSGAVFIDLGEEWSVVEERRARERPRPGRRAPLAALLLVVVLLSVGGSAVTTSPFTPLATFDAANVSATQIGGGGVFVAGGTGTALFVARYAEDTGAMTWKTALPDRADSLAYLPGAGVVTAWSYSQDAPSRVMVLDAATGARLWELSGELYGPATLDAKQALTVTGDPNTPAQARYIDLRTGRAIWTRPVPARAQIVATAGFVVVAAPDGTVTLLARDTGAVLGSLKVDLLVPDDATLNQPDIAMVNVIGGRMLVSRRIGTPDGEVASYDLPGLTLRWLRSGLLPGYPWPCGPNLCLSGVTGDMTALDPATGASRWTIEGWQAPAGDLGGGRMLAFREGGLDHAGILDSTTSRLLGDLGNWTVVSGPDIHLALQPVRGNFRSTWVGVVDPGRAMVRPVGRLDGLSTRGCISRGDLLVCPTTDAKVRVWRYHPGQ
jgi:hypothetical protein